MSITSVTLKSKEGSTLMQLPIEENHFPEKVLWEGQLLKMLKAFKMELEEDRMLKTYSATRVLEALTKNYDNLYKFAEAHLEKEK